jgi:CTP:phosphocholine cytidylyltransferase-like protein
MLTVAGKTIIGRIIDGLVENGITDIIVVTGYRAEELTSYLNTMYPLLQFTFINNDKFRETNNIYSMALAFENITIDSDIILIESDLIYKPEVITRLINSNFKNVALVDKYRVGMDGTVVTVENSVITNVIPPHLQSESFDFSDKYKTHNIFHFRNYRSIWKIHVSNETKVGKLIIPKTSESIFQHLFSMFFKIKLCHL